MNYTSSGREHGQDKLPSGKMVHPLKKQVISTTFFTFSRILLCREVILQFFNLRKRG